MRMVASSQRQPVRQLRGRRLRPVGPAARRRQPGRASRCSRTSTQAGDDGSKFIDAAKDKNSGKRLMGFGHRVYKNYDPRAKIIKKACDELLEQAEDQRPAARHRQAPRGGARCSDSYFVERKLYPNVDFYSGIIMRAIGIPVDMFTVMFAIGRMPGWIANCKEIVDDPTSRIYRPRQVYTGPTDA
ncbi:MAG: hypothetical protein MZV65_01235 [Chromatiales bacterium]|nr:hypothetical protein [Chromatiales bacterium]